MTDLIIKLVTSKRIDERDIEQALYEICDEVHSSCDSLCPVYLLNGNKPVNADKDFNINRGCDCFKSGKNMLKFIRENNK